MLTASDAYKAAILPGTTQMRRTACRVTLNVSEADVTYGTPTAENGEAGFSDVTEVVDNVSINTYRIATCEPNYWRLDGSTVFYPAVSINVGYASEEVCDADGLFSEMKADPVVVIPVSTFTTKGITLFFDVLSGDYPTEFDIDILNGATSVYHLAVTGNDSAYYVLDADINAALATCDTVKIVFRKMCEGYRRARLSEIFMGFQAVYGIGGLDEMISLNTIKEIDPTCATLPHGEAVLKLSNVNGDFNLINPSGIAEDLQAGAEMVVEHGAYVSDGLIEYVKTGTYLFRDWKDAGGKMVNLNGVDTLGYYGGMKVTNKYSGRYARTPADHLAGVIDNIGLPAALIDLTTFPTVTFMSCECGDTLLDELRMVAQVCRKICVVDETGVIRFVDLETASSSDISLDDCYSDPAIERQAIIGGVDIICSYPASAGSPSTILENVEAVTGAKTYTFEIGQMWSLPSVAVTGATSYTAHDFDHGRIVVDVVGDGSDVTITITGNQLTYVKTVYSLDNTLAADVKANRVEVNNPHFWGASSTTVSLAAEWILANYNHLLKFNASWRGNPALEMGDMATAETVHGDKNIIVTRQDLTFDKGALDGSLEGVG